MATSSMPANFRVTNPKSANVFVCALCDSDPLDMVRPVLYPSVRAEYSVGVSRSSSDFN